MHDSLHEAREFAFPLPLAWPREKGERREYQSALIEYTRLMQPLVAATATEQRKELLEVMASFADDLRKLWARDDMPAEIGEFLKMFEYP